MSASKKEYDPLSGLFGGSPGMPLPEVSDESAPTASSAADAPEPGLGRGVKPVSRPAARAPEAAEAPAKAPAGPDPRELAKILAKAAAAKAAAAAPRPAAPAPAAPAGFARTLPPPVAAPAAPAMAGRAM
ncbi:MAG: hypothetical protein Q8P41_12610, partial [Pseudomonadota bacterium]|nr:hypothetical protein [Pseudomonadota bacterium]